MKFRGRKPAITLVTTAMVVLGLAAPTHAAPAWELVGTRTATSVLTGILSTSVNLIPVVGTPCVPSTREVKVEGRLQVETWWNPATLQIRYDEFGSGSATVSTNCPGTSVTVETEVVDYAPAGSPTMVQDGSRRTTTPDRRNGATFISAYASDVTRVIYYDPPAAGYSRGNSAISVRVTGYYTNPKGPTQRYGCMQATWVVTPTPYGPIFMNEEPYMSQC